MKTLVWIKKDNREFYHLYQKLDKRTLDDIYSTLLNDGLISDYYISKTNLRIEGLEKMMLEDGKNIKVQIIKE